MVRRRSGPTDLKKSWQGVNSRKSSREQIRVALVGPPGRSGRRSPQCTARRRWESSQITSEPDPKEESGGDPTGFDHRAGKAIRIIHYHTHDSRRSPAGFPDLVLAHEKTGNLIFIECKSEKGVRSEDQIKWARTLNNSPVRYYVWRPSHWANGTVESVLKLGANRYGKASGEKDNEDPQRALRQLGISIEACWI